MQARADTASATRHNMRRRFPQNPLRAAATRVDGHARPLPTSPGIPAGRAQHKRCRRSATSLVAGSLSIARRCAMLRRFLS